MSDQSSCITEDPNKHHAFYYNPNFEITEDGWKSFHLESEYARLIAGSRDFRVINANKGFQVT